VGIAPFGSGRRKILERSWAVCRLTQIKAARRAFAMIDLLRAEETLKMETIAATVGVTLPFIIFAVALFWAELQTRSPSH
jgi:hypothetical protein